jgi:hypothetical protein
MEKHVIQVTKWIKPESELSEWNDYLVRKGYSTLVKSKKNSKGKSIFCLFRNISEEETKEVKSNKWFITNNSLERNIVYGPRLKTN